MADYARDQLRFTTLARTHPAEAARPAAHAQHAVDLRWDTYEEMATRPAHRFPAEARPARGG